MNELVTTGSHHHRIQHHLGDAIRANGICHHLHHLRGVQHADLDGIDPNVLHHGVNLRLEHQRRNAVNARHPAGVLRSDGRNGRHAVAAQCTEGFQIGLNACATAAVRACDGQHPRITRQGSGGTACGQLLRSHAKNYDPSQGLFTRCCRIYCCCAVIAACGRNRGVPLAAHAAQRAAEKNPRASTAPRAALLPDPDHAGVGSFTRAAAAHSCNARFVHGDNHPRTKY